MIKLFSTLIGIGGVCGILLVGTHAATKDQIEQNRLDKTKLLMTRMLGHEIPANIATSQPFIGDCNLWIFSTLQIQGYAGLIHLTALGRLGSNEARLTLRVVQHSETPGIGDFIDHQKSAWMSYLDNMTLNAFQTVDNVSGATITTNAIRKAALKSIEQLGAYCARPN